MKGGVQLQIAHEICSSTLPLVRTPDIHVVETSHLADLSSLDTGVHVPSHGLTHSRANLTQLQVHLARPATPCSVSLPYPRVTRLFPVRVWLSVTRPIMADTPLVLFPVLCTCKSNATKVSPCTLIMTVSKCLSVNVWGMSLIQPSLWVNYLSRQNASIQGLLYKRATMCPMWWIVRVSTLTMCLDRQFTPGLQPHPTFNNY